MRPVHGAGRTGCGPPASYVVIVTHSRATDRIALRQALRQGAACVDMMGESGGFSSTFLRKGVSQKALVTVHMPIRLVTLLSSSR